MSMNTHTHSLLISKNRHLSCGSGSTLRFVRHITVYNIPWYELRSHRNWEVIRTVDRFSGNRRIEPEFLLSNLLRFWAPAHCRSTPTCPFGGLFVNKKLVVKHATCSNENRKIELNFKHSNALPPSEMDVFQMQPKCLSRMCDMAGRAMCHVGNWFAF